MARHGLYCHPFSYVQVVVWFELPLELIDTTVQPTHVPLKCSIQGDYYWDRQVNGKKILAEFSGRCQTINQEHVESEAPAWKGQEKNQGKTGGQEDRRSWDTPPCR